MILFSVHSPLALHVVTVNHTWVHKTQSSVIPGLTLPTASTEFWSCSLSSWQSGFSIIQICHSDRDYPSKSKEKRMTCKRLHAILFQVLQSKISVYAYVVILTLIISLTIHLILLSQLAWAPLDANLVVTILIKMFMVS